MSDPSKSREMKERWRDPVYREQALRALHEASLKHAANRRSSAEGGYRRRSREFNADRITLAATATDIPQRRRHRPEK